MWGGMGGCAAADGGCRTSRSRLRLSECRSRSPDRGNGGLLIPSWPVFLRGRCHRSPGTSWSAGRRLHHHCRPVFPASDGDACERCRRAAGRRRIGRGRSGRPAGSAARRAMCPGRWDLIVRAMSFWSPVRERRTRRSTRGLSDGGRRTCRMVDGKALSCLTVVLALLVAISGQGGRPRTYHGGTAGPPGDGLRSRSGRWRHGGEHPTCRESVSGGIRPCC